jgi:hypothetical protein
MKTMESNLFGYENSLIYFGCIIYTEAQINLKKVTSPQVTWEWLRREIYWQILTIFRRERISASVYSKCIGLRSLDRIKYITAKPPA